MNRELWSRIIVGLLALSIASIIYFSYSLFSKKNCRCIVDNLISNMTSNKTAQSIQENGVKNGFVVRTPNCHIPDMDAFDSDTMKFFRQKYYEKCLTNEDVTHIEKGWSADISMVYNSSVFVGTECCYSEISRAGTDRNTDNDFKLSSCTEFNDTIKLPSTAEYIYVKCESENRLVYQNTHAVVRDRPDILQRLTDMKEGPKNHRPLSILMLSIDSISRSNFIRLMPKTNENLRKNGWFELQGYNKIDDNTYPNLMAILTGYNYTTSMNECQPEKVGKLDTCPFIWYDYRANGYVTAYAEDETYISIFAHMDGGFKHLPTDYYLRPYMMAAERLLPVKIKNRMKICVGSKHSAEHIYDYAMDFATHFKDQPSIGLFWVNSFSHEDISDPSAMDHKIVDYVHVLTERGILNESMVVLFSDHGIRFGETRYSLSGWYEERLPFFYIWLPDWFRNQHTDFVRALKVNRNRLTTPYDFHMTLKHILQLINPKQSYAPPSGCPKCQSLFTEIPLNRSCEDASIETHWCTCAKYLEHDKNDKIVQDVVQFILDDVNRMLNKYNDDHNKTWCAELKLKDVYSVRKAEHRNVIDPRDDYVTIFSVSPSNGYFEATVSHRNDTGFQISSFTSRLTRYKHQAKCMQDKLLRKYCYCLDESR